MGVTSSVSGSLGDDDDELINVDTAAFAQHLGKQGLLDELPFNININTNVNTDIDSGISHNSNNGYQLQHNESKAEEDINDINPIHFNENDLILAHNIGNKTDDYDAQSDSSIHDVLNDINPGNIVLFVGKNSNGEAGLGHIKILKELTELPSWIENIYSGNAFTIYTSNDNKIIYASGSNYHGACGINNLKPNVIKHTKVKYFNENNINIKRICVSSCSSCTFWLTDDHKVYGNGLNDKYQLGLTGKSNKAEPRKIRDLQLIENIQSALEYSIALVSIHTAASLVVSYWARKLRIKSNPVPDEIVYLITQFTENNRIYSTEHGHGTTDADGSDKWNLLTDFKDVNIIQIRTGYMHSLFLDSNGFVWSCGSNLHGQIGSSHNDGKLPKEIEYFVENDIRIKQIAAGSFHNLALDFNGKVYSWGNNWNGQCGVGSTDNVMVPKLIQYLKHITVVNIECGYHHSYCKTIDNMHYLFGKNGHNECITYGEKDYVDKPHCINNIIKDKYRYKIIKSISLGSQNTKIIIGDK